MLITCATSEMANATEKSISGIAAGTYFHETYAPGKDIKGNYQNEVVYGFSAGLDEVNASVMLMQQHGSGIISLETTMEQSPLVADPAREMKRIALEKLDEATFAGLLQKAAAPPEQGGLTVEQLAAIRKAMEDDSMALHDAIAKVTEAAPLAQPAPGAQPTPGAPGMAGAMGGEQPLAPMPALSDLQVSTQAISGSNRFGAMARTGK